MEISFWLNDGPYEKMDAKQDWMKKVGGLW